jgi:hypothetical protein
MRSPSHTAAVAALLVAMTGPAPLPGAAQTPGPDVTAATEVELGDQVLNGCNTEFARFCAEVAPGEGRLFACLYAHATSFPGNATTRSITRRRGSSEARVAQCLKDHASELMHHAYSVYITVAKGEVWAGKRVDHNITKLVSNIADTVLPPREAARETLTIIREVVSRDVSGSRRLGA